VGLRNGAPGTVLLLSYFVPVGGDIASAARIAAENFSFASSKVILTSVSIVPRLTEIVLSGLAQTNSSFGLVIAPPWPVYRVAMVAVKAPTLAEMEEIERDMKQQGRGSTFHRGQRNGRRLLRIGEVLESW
jgi:hypothetical protein